QYYNDKDYHTPENQTWAILQDKRGIMYFGNNAGLLEYDGKTWRLIEMPNKSVVRSLGMDENGKIYVGATNEFGYIEANSTGTIQYYSLTNIVPEEYRNFNDVWQTFIINGQIILRTSSYLLLIKGDKIKIIEADDRFHLSFNINRKFYVRERSKGLFYLENDSLILIPNSQLFANLRIYAMIPYQKNKFLLVTRENGIYVYSPSEHHSFTKPEKLNELDDFIIKSQIYCGDTLDKNHMLLGTTQNGFIIIDNDGNIVKHINTESGLNNNTVYSIYINGDKNLWIGLNNGISYIPINSQFELLNKKNGLLGGVYYAISYQNDIYTGNSLGVFYEYERNKFKMVNNSEGQSWFLTEINKNLYCANFEGLLRINKGDAINVAPIGNVWKIVELTHNPGYYLVGTDEGLALFEFANNELAFKHRIEGFNETARYFHESNSGNIWISNSNIGVYKLKLNPQLDQITSIEFYTKNNGLPANTNNYVFKINTPEGSSRIIFGTERGIYKYNAQSNSFVPDEIFNHFLTGEGFVYLFEQDKKSNIYYEQGEEKGLLLLQNDNSYKLVRTPFLKLEGLYIENIAVIDSATVFFGNKDGIVQYNPFVKYAYNKSFPVLIRRVLAKDSIIYGGAHRAKEIKYFPYKNNALQFQYSGLSYEDNDKMQYSYYLEGFDPENEWSSWSFKTEKEYTNLTEGFYSFKVKARNVYKKESNIAIYQFEILPPWYRTILAFISYVIFLIL
ncbi:two-component regulator propeller domain-containing protein, partial [Bacteroidota bacterium]